MKAILNLHPKPMNSGITTRRVAGCQRGDHPPERLKRCGSAAGHGTREAEVGPLPSLSSHNGRYNRSGTNRRTMQCN